MKLILDSYIRRVVLFVLDLLIVSGSYYLAFRLRLDPDAFESFREYEPTLWNTLPWLLVIRVLCGLLVRQYAWSFRFASLSEAVALVRGTVAGSVFFVLVFHRDLGHFAQPLPDPPQLVYVVEFAFTLMGFGFVRFFPRYLYQLYVKRSTRLAARGENMRTLIYGAGATGELILRDLLRLRTYPYHVVGFVDDSPARWNASIHGCRVLGALQDLPELIRRHEIDLLLIAIPNLSPARLREVIDLCSDAHVRFKTVPAYARIVAAGDAAPLALKDVQLEDLLQREPIAFDESRMAEFFLDKTVLVTGAGGSIGAEICRQVLRHGAKRLVAVDLNENAMYFLQLELEELAPHAGRRFEIGSVRDLPRMRSLFAREKPRIVFHAAAHKHVPAMELCPGEALKNNVVGTHHVAACAHECGAECFVMVSTDKAVRPTNVMGASKRLAEFVVHALEERSSTRFMTVRFGNVLGSNGSLVQILERQISRGGPVTITHPKMKRFFMTIPEAVGLVLVAAVQNEGSLCVLEMGEQLVIERLAREMISLSGLVPDRDIRIVYTGLRPGEKMYEELFDEDERMKPSTHPKIRLAGQLATVDVPAMLGELEAAVAADSPEPITAFLRRWVPGYASRDAADADEDAASARITSR